jgi:hypothetical protein
MNQEYRDTTTSQTGDETPAWLNIIRKKVESLRFGVVQIIVHDSEVVQIERTERIRFGGASSGRAARPVSVEGPS